jgi:hypothetical protein
MGIHKGSEWVFHKLERTGSRFYVQLNHAVTLRTGLGLSRVIILQGTHMD